MARTSFTYLGSEADSPEPLLGPSPATGHAAEILDVYNPYLGYDAEEFPYQPPQQKMRPTCRTGLLGGAHDTKLFAQILARSFGGAHRKPRQNIVYFGAE
jgi:hypothetical protein